MLELRRMVNGPIEYLDRYQQALTLEDVNAAREQLVREYAWAIPNEQALATLVELSPLVELGAGGGYWRMLLRERGADVDAYDLQPYSNPWVKRGWTYVSAGGPDVLDDVTGRTLFVCWPAHETGLAGQCLALFRGDSFAYAGELGDTPDRTFNELLAAEWNLTQRVELPHWPGFHDDLTVWRRRHPTPDQGGPQA